MEKFLSAIILFFCSLILIYLNELFRKKCKYVIVGKSSNSLYIDLIFQLFLLRILLYYLLPSITHVIIDWKNQDIERVFPIEISIVYIVEVISHFIYYLSFYYLCKNVKGSISLNFEITACSKIIAFFFLFLYVCFSLNSSALVLLSFCDSLWMLEPFVVTAGTVVCFFFVIIGHKYWGNFWFLMGLLVTLFYLVTSFATGIRGKLFWPVFWMLFLVYYLDRERMKTVLLFSSAILFVLLVFQGGMTAIRGNKEVDIMSIIQSISSSSNDSNKSLLEEIDFRFGALTHYSTGFYRMAERGEVAGLNPILNSLYSPIPRVYMPDKPVPCSADGDLYSMGMYKTQAEITNIDTNMVEFSTAAHAYWELYGLGVILYSIIPAFYVFFSIKLFRKLGLLGLPLFVCVFKPWGYNDPKIWVSEIMLQMSQIIIPVFALLFIYMFFNRIKFKRII